MALPLFGISDSVNEKFFSFLSPVIMANTVSLLNNQNQFIATT